MTLPAPTRARSTFVNLLAWYGLLSGLGTASLSVFVLSTGITWTALGVLATGITSVAASWGLVRRREWARQALIGVQAYGMLIMLLRVVIPGLLFSGVRVSRDLPPETYDRAVAMTRSTALMNLLIAALIGGFVIYKLSTRRVREEFSE